MMIGHRGSRRRSFSSSQMPCTPVSSKSTMQASARPCARKGSASSRFARSSTRYRSGLRAARIASVTSGCAPRTSRVFMARFLRRVRRGADGGPAGPRRSPPPEAPRSPSRQTAEGHPAGADPHPRHPCSRYYSSFRSRNCAIVAIRLTIFARQRQQQRLRMCSPGISRILTRGFSGLAGGVKGRNRLRVGGWEAFYFRGG